MALWQEHREAEWALAQRSAGPKGDLQPCHGVLAGHVCLPQSQGSPGWSGGTVGPALPPAAHRHREGIERHVGAPLPQDWLDGL